MTSLLSRADRDTAEDVCGTNGAHQKILLDDV